MSRSVFWHRAAEADLAEAHGFIGADSPEMADRLLDAIEPATSFLLEMPEAGIVREFADARARGIRSWAIHGFDAHLIFYRPRSDGIEIVRALHVARDLSNLLWDAE